MFIKILKILVGLILIFMVAIGLISINHPIILKWIGGSARILDGKVNTKVYTNGHLNNRIEIYQATTYWNENQANYYLLHFKYADTKESTEVISVNIKDRYVGKPAGTNKNDYDIICGSLFQSEVGAKFSKFTDDMKGYDFDPKLIYEEGVIQFNIPPAAIQFKCDSIRVLFL